MICSTSDHNPIFLEIFSTAQILVNQSKKRKRFHFEQFWVEEDDCGLLMNEAWQRGLHSNGSIHNCLRSVSHALSQWHHLKFGNFRIQIQESQRNLLRLHSLGASSVSMSQINHAESQLDDLLRKEEIF